MNCTVVCISIRSSSILNDIHWSHRKRTKAAKQNTVRHWPNNSGFLSIKSLIKLKWFRYGLFALFSIGHLNYKLKLSFTLFHEYLQRWQIEYSYYRLKKCWTWKMYTSYDTRNFPILTEFKSINWQNLRDFFFLRIYHVSCQFSVNLTLRNGLKFKQKIMFEIETDNQA